MFDLTRMKCVSRIGDVFARHAASARMQRELQETSDRALAEIGLARGDIFTVVKGRFNRP